MRAGPKIMFHAGRRKKPRITVVFSVVKCCEPITDIDVAGSAIEVEAAYACAIRAEVTHRLLSVSGTSTVLH